MTTRVARQESARTVRLARWISIAAHPFILILLLTAAGAAASLPPRQALLVVGAVAATSILPLTFYLRRQVRTGRATDFDVSVRTQRRPMYVVALLLCLGTLAALALAGTPPAFLSAILAAIALLAASSLVNRWLKASLHTGFAVYVAIGMLDLSLPAGAAFAAVAGLVAWSRLALSRHTLPEVAAGSALGALAGLLAVWVR